LHTKFAHPLKTIAIIVRIKMIFAGDGGGGGGGDVGGVLPFVR
jgi:hypothetical protein